MNFSTTSFLRNIFITATLLLMSIAASAATIYSSTCDNAESGWTYTNASGNSIQQGGYWMIDHSGDYIVSETFDLSSYTNLVLEYDIRSYGSGSHTNSIVEFSDDDGVTWNAGTFTTATTTTSYSTQTFNVGTISSSTVKFRFNRPTVAARGIRIDNILFTGDFSSTPCTTPSAPTALNFSNITINSLDGDFTASSGGADGYIVVRKTTAGAPSPVDGNSYSVGAGLGGQIIYDGTNTNFSDNSLASSTTYYYYVFAYNNAGCTGGPLYSSALGNNVTTATPTTAVQFTSSNASVTEGTPSVTLTLSILNPSGSNATSATVSLGSGNGRVNGFTSQVVNWAAGDATNKTITLLVSDNSACDGTENLTFNISTVTGGTSASAGSQSSFDLTVNDNDLTAGVQYGQDFESGSSVYNNWSVSGGGSNQASASNNGSLGRELGGSDTDTYSSVNIAGFTNTTVSFNLEAVGGFENSDEIRIYVALNGASFSSTPELVIRGCQGSPYNSSWNYNANGVANDIVNGSTTTLTAPCGSSINGYAVVNLSIPDGNTEVAIRLEGSTNSGSEYFNYDDLTLRGEYCAAPVPTIVTSTAGPLNFGNVQVGNNATQTYTVEGTDLTDPIVVTAPTGYQVSTDGTNFFNSLNLTPSAGTVSTTTITVRFTPVTNTTYNGDITHTSTGATQVDVAVTGAGTVPCTTPLNQATNLNLTPTATSIAGTFTPAAGGADGYLVVVSTSSSLGATPSNTSTYTPGQSIGSGTVVSSAAGTSFTATGLSVTTQYYLHVYAYNNAACTGGPLYKTPALVNNATTLSSPFAAFDVFNRADNDNLGIPSSGGVTAWSEVDAGGADGVEIYDNHLDINSYASDTAAWAYFDMSPLYATNYDAATSELIWMFNMGSTRYNPSGFGQLNNYGTAVVLGADGTNFHTGANGYAVILGESGSVDPLRIVRFTGGLVGGTQTSIVSDGGDWDDELFSVKVTYNPTNGLWTLETYDGGTALPFTDPASTTYTTNNTGTDQTYTGTDLPYFGAFWNMSCNCGEWASFDNFYIPTAQACNNSTWTGVISTDWFEAGNWSCNEVPTSSTTVTIPNVSSASGNFPEVAAVNGFTAYTGDLTINPGATINVLGVNNVNLEVYGDLTNNGAASVGNGKVILKGASAQTVTGTITFTHLDIDNAAGVTLGTGTKTVYGTLSLVNGTLTTNNRLTIGSNATRTGLVDEFTSGYNGTISGNLTVQRYANNTASSFFYVGAPVGGASVNNWTGVSLATQNGATNGSQVIPTSTCSITELAVGSPYGRLFDYRENQVNTCNLEGWHVRTSGAIGNAQGFAAIVPSGNIIGLNGSFVTGPVTSVNLTYTANSAPAPGSGFNLVANPYAAPIDWVSVATANSGSINGTAYMYQTSGGLAGTYNAVNQISGGGEIGTSQSFFVETTGNNVNITFDNSMKRNGTNNTLRTTPVYQNKLVANVSGNGFADRAIVAFGSNFTTGFDAQFDARKLMSKVGQPSLYVNNGAKLAINAEPSIEQTQMIPLHMAPGADGTFLLEFDLSEFDPTAMIYLEDLKYGSMQNLWLNNSYSFAANATDNADRFVLHFYPGLQVSTTDQTCAGNDGALALIQLGSTEWDYTLVDANGTIVDANAQLNGTQVAGMLAAGTYQIVLNHSSGHTVTRNITITGVDAVTAELESVLIANIGEIISFGNISTGATTYTWDFGDGNTSSSFAPAHAYAQAGVYTVTLTASNGTCTDTYTATLKVGDVVNSITDITEGEINVYSFNNILYVNFSTELSGVAELDIFDLTGRKVYETQHLTPSGSHKLPLVDVVSGHYFVQLRTINGTDVHRVYISDKK